MKNRFSTYATHALRALSIMALCGLSSACKDDYILDDEKPDWLYENIYSYLERKGTFTNYLQLMQDKDINTEGARDLKEVLSKTGSKTVFVANDEAWDKFFRHNATLPASNPWHNATSYGNLTPAQKKLLIHTSMLNNAIVMENLSAADGDGTKAPEPGQYMRRYTDVDVLDTITYIPAKQVPISYSPTDEDYWAKFRGKEDAPGPGIYLVTDATRNMMLHFTREHMGRGDVDIRDDEDFKIIMGEGRKTDDVHIYNARLIEKDSVAENGYVNVTEKVLVPLPSMAEVIRTSGRTNIFAHMMDRFSYPYPNTTLTENYRNLHPDFSGTIYTKLYFTETMGARGKSQVIDPNNVTVGAERRLEYDPGWNEYSLTDETRKDMAAMFVPDDETFIREFSTGGSLSQFISTYTPEHKDYTFDINDLETLYRKIDYIPLDNVRDLLNNHMHVSFVNAVPHKIQNLRDDISQDAMFTPDDVANIDTCLLACNGAIYVMKAVYGPANFVSVAGPANITETNTIMRWAINDGKDNATSEQMHMNYYAYLTAMRSTFSLFLPSDDALTRTYDPISFTSQHARAIRIEKKDKGTPPLDFYNYPYNTTTGVLADSPFLLDTPDKWSVLNRLRTILESHTIVHNDDNPIDNEDEYYLAKNGSGLKVTKAFNPSTGKYAVTKVQGGFQLENERAGITGGSPGTWEIEVAPSNTYEERNGTTFVINDAPIIPASKSIYHALTQEFPEEGDAFYALTDFDGNDDIVKAVVRDPKDVKNYSFWYGGSTTGAIDFNVKFLSNYNYTVLVPTADAIADAISKGLPTWESIREDFENSIERDEKGEPMYWDTGNNHVMWIHEIDPETGLPEEESTDSLRVLAQVTYLHNFLRCHFIDNSFFEDKSARTVKDFSSFSYDQINGTFVKVYMGRQPSHLVVHDAVGGPELTTTGNLRNILTSDMICIKDDDGSMSGEETTPTTRPSMKNIALKSSSSAVVHQINGVLCHTKLTANGRHDGAWKTTADCKRYLRRFHVPSTSTIQKMKRHE